MVERIDFAKQYLHEKGIKIFAGGKQILKYDNDFYYPKKELITSIIPAKDFIKIKEGKEYYIVITSYRKLKDMFSYGVLSEQIEQTIDKKTKTKRIWRLVKIKEGVNIMSEISNNVKDVEFRHYPLINAIRGIGDKFVDEEKHKIGFIKEGDTGLIFLDKKEDEIKKDISISSWYNRRMGIEEEQVNTEREKMVIPEVEFLISEDNHLVCIDKKKDMQRIIIVSMIGKGKSYGTNGLAGRIFYKFKDNVAMIDPLGIFKKISVPSNDFKEELSRLGEEPLPIPAIHLKMSAPNLEMENDITFRFVINFYNFLLRYKYFTYGISKYELGGAEKYMNTLLRCRDVIEKVKDAGGIKNILAEQLANEVTGEVEKSMWAMIYKWRDTFEGIFKEQFTDNLFENDFSEWEIKDNHLEFKTNPFNASLYSGLFTVLNIKDVKRYPTFRNRFADLIQQFIDFQSKFKRRSWIIPDEMNEFYEYKKGKTNDNCSEAVIELFRQGRNLNIGIIGNTQSYDGLDLDIRKNTNILLCGTINTDSEARLIAKDYKLDSNERDRLGKLNTFEFMVMSKDPLVFYDNLGSRYCEKRTFVGRLVPPISTHSPPERNE